VVALAGYLFNERRGNADRASTREITAESHAHERQLAQGERKYNDRREVYVDVLRRFLVEVQIIERTENEGELRESPAMPPEDEWLDLRARVGAVGSGQVAEAFERFDSKVRDFHDHVLIFQHQMTNEDAVREARREAKEAYTRVEVLIRNELDTL
jgi:hypothetical protein